MPVTIALQHTDGTSVDYLLMGVGWTPVTRRRWFRVHTAQVDLNAVALLYAGRSLVEVVYHDQLNSHDGAVRLQGDNLTGAGPGDDEVISLELTRLDPAITRIFLAVTATTGEAADLRQAHCRLLDGHTGGELVRYPLHDSAYPGLLMGVLEREAPAWKFQQIAMPLAARHPLDVVPRLDRYLA
ncbi:TerD family protein [Nocardia pseudobrasiliensis]|uniref:Tellurium resistance protein TerZ n=1 Tax=Nocardia pseudobrasiliensis TaxID=45979 RepID=A0A370HYH0_9NOCA|nr:TerD family protein [Nocardia pseudobrasiliensis]RDI63547.1 tellurium resistance protein TerZ [Nocardia pseudobrasiliensis]